MTKEVAIDGVKAMVADGRIGLHVDWNWITIPPNVDAWCDDTEFEPVEITILVEE